jgi:hypothetical protein
MNVEQLSLARQLDMVFKELQQELSQLSSGTVFIQIRNNLIGKFGIRHLPLEAKDGKIERVASGLTELQQRALLKLAIESLKYKTSWTHGEIYFDFAIRQGRLCTSVQFESNHNMSNVLLRKTN